MILYQDIVKNGNLFYASTDRDSELCKWSLKQTKCNVKFYEVLPVSDLDKVFIHVVHNNGTDNSIEANQMATLLGFNVIGNFNSYPKRYADKAELSIFNALVRQVAEWGLITKSKDETGKHFINLTKWGEYALLNNCKFKFYKGEKLLLENNNIDDNNNLDFFPFYKTLGFATDINSKHLLEYNEVSPGDICTSKSDLTKRLDLQSDSDNHIFFSEQTKYFDFTNRQVKINLYEHDEKIYPIVFYQNEISEEATAHINSNRKLREIKIEWGKYLRLMNDPYAILDYDTISEFEDILNFDDIIKDSRVQWNDTKLFTLIALNADANQWHSITHYSPAGILKIHLNDSVNENKVSDLIDWTEFTLRVDNQYIIDNPSNPWNFEIISENVDAQNINFVKQLLTIPEIYNHKDVDGNSDIEWDWQQIMPLLDNAFIIENISNVDFDLSTFTEQEQGISQQLILQYPQKRWNWQFVSSDYSLIFIRENISAIVDKLNLSTVFDRIFSDEETAYVFASDNNFHNSIRQQNAFRNYYSANSKKYVWNEATIDFFESLDLISWPSSNYSSGFECSPAVKWNEQLFSNYNSKIETEKGFAHVSATISNFNIVLSYPDFHWDWSVLSSNSELVSHNEFLTKVFDRLDKAILVKNINSQQIELLFNDFSLKDFLNEESWQEVTRKVTIDFVRNHIDLDWDWSVLTKRFCSTIKVYRLGNERWISKWDWNYLTQNLPIDDVKDYLDDYADYWDWDYLTKSVEKTFLLANIANYYQYWNWKVLLEERLSKDDLQYSQTSHLIEIATVISNFDEECQKPLWNIITKKFNCRELIEILIQTEYTKNAALFKWDFEYLYNLSDFDIQEYLNQYSDIVRWNLLSCSSALSQLLKQDKSFESEKVYIRRIIQLLKEYDWDFLCLSKLDVINSNPNFLSIKTEKWDWKYLSEYAFLDNIGEIIKKFSNYLQFDILSHRTDVHFAKWCFEKEYENKGWDWETLSSNTSAKITSDYVVNHSEKKWDFTALSQRLDIKFTNEQIIKLKNKNWDWSAISTRNDLDFNEQFILEIADKPCNWFSISQRESFIPNENALSVLEKFDLDWMSISGKALSPNVINEYRQKLDWRVLTKNEHFEISIENLRKYKDYVEWEYVSKSEKFKPTFDILSEFSNKVDWVEINRRSDFVIDNQVLESFTDFIDWGKASSSQDIDFSETLVEKFHKNWDWVRLRQNPQAQGYFEKYKPQLNCADFIGQFDRTPYIYHFTHLFNAIDIIKYRKILSRNKAEGHFTNSAGGLVDRRGTAHNFARFYFRPQTPTQFYNECLGMDSESGYWKVWYHYGEHKKWKTYYPQAVNLGLPKCPMPVFFKFDLAEILRVMPDKCFYSTGNMQTDWAQVVKVEENPNRLNTDYLYSDASDYENYKKYAQQEFLVEEEFDFSELKSFEIICYDEEQANLLKEQLGDDPICKKITSVGYDIFHRNNRKLKFEESGNKIFLSSDYHGKAYFSIQGDISNLQIYNPNLIIKSTPTEIIIYPNIELAKPSGDIEIHFIDMDARTKDWLVYSSNRL